MKDFSEYAELGEVGFQGGAEQVAPEEEFFHSVYVSSSNRKNHINITEQVDKFQIRGVQYNLDEVNMIITHTKEILTKVKTERGKDTTECFSFKRGEPPWYGTSKLPNGQQRQCPQTSPERAVNDFCSSCRAQIIVAGIYCKADGSPILTEEKKPIFVFIRGKGMRYSNVSKYLGDLYSDDKIQPLIQPATDQTRAFEKAVVNNKRFITNITSTKEQSQYGNSVNVFVLNRGIQLDKNTVEKVLQLSKQTLNKFEEKFDWSKRRGVANYGQAVEGVLSTTTDESPFVEESKENTKKEEPAGEQSFNFNDITF